MDLKSVLNDDTPKAPPPKSTPPKHDADLKLNPPPQPYNYSARRDTYPQPPPPPQSQSPSARDLSSPNGHPPQQHYGTWGLPGAATTPHAYPSPHQPNKPPDAPYLGHSPLERSATMPHTNGQQVFSQQSPSVITPQSANSTSSFQHPQYRPSSVHSLTPTSAHSSGPGFHRDSSSGAGGGVGHSPVQTQQPPYHAPRYQSFAEGSVGQAPPPFDARGSVSTGTREGSVPRLQEPVMHQSGISFPPRPPPQPLRPQDAALAPYPGHTAHAATQPLNTNTEYLSAVDRDRSESVSPKSLLPSQRRDISSAIPPPPSSLPPTLPNPHSPGHSSERPPPSSAHSSDRPPSRDTREQPSLHSHQSNTAQPSPSTKPPSRSPEREIRPDMAIKVEAAQPPPPIKSESMEVDAKPASTTQEDQQAKIVQAEPSLQPKPKRVKIREKPIWAHKAQGSRGTRIFKTNPHASNGVGAAHRRRSPPTTRTTPPLPAPQPRATPPVRDADAPGDWEKSILNLEPQEELTKTVADFLFCHVVNRPDAEAAGIEIEAKVGLLIDRDRGERLRLPVLTECIVSRDDPSLRVKFESSVTEDQHRRLNNFLNEAVTKSHAAPRKSIAQPRPSDDSAASSAAPAPPRPRVKVTYVHTRETDSFHDLTPAAEAALPPAARSALMARSAGGRGGGPGRPSVRLSVDQKTGAELARIVKVRLADLDVHCPQSPFDWRLSINLEVPVPAGAAAGEAGALVDAVDPGTGRKRPHRNKDRLTYRHQAYRIDLTQVTVGDAPPAAAGAKPEREHELELELDAATLREAGRRAAEGEAGRFQDVVRGFVDNVRLLVRHCPPV